MSYDVIALGETMLRLTPPGYERFEQTSQFEVHIGGSESNTAVGCARLGLRTAWLSRLTDNPLGRMIESAIRQQDVDTSHVVWTDQDRVGTYYLQRGKSPRMSQVLYDRRASAAANWRPEDLPEHLFRPQNSRVLHTTGITLGISETAAQTAMRAIELAEAAGWLNSFDVNYRSRLWSVEQARIGCSNVIGKASVVFIASRDVTSLFGIPCGDAAGMLEQLGQQFPGPILVMTRGREGAAARSPEGAIFEQSAFVADEVERLGGGDAFSAGFLRGFLECQDLATALRWGAAVAALKYTTPGDLPLIDAGEAEAMVCNRATGGLSR
jgi:2-dehydro-3-deoxygluconokinase